MKRRLLIQIHGYIAVFFLPLALLYAVTGTLYITGETGGVVHTDTTVILANIPDTHQELLPLIEPTLIENNWQVPSLSDYAREFPDGYRWSYLGESIRVTFPLNELGEIAEGQNEITIFRGKNTWYKQLVEIHKDHAGFYFSILGFAFGIGMLIMTISGGIMMLQSPVHKRIALILVTAGTFVTLATWAYTLFA